MSGEPRVVYEKKLGRIVLCDSCNADYTNSTEQGGFLFGSRAICPSCAPEWRASAKKHNEEAHIKAECPTDKSFADFVRGIRGPDASIRITTF